jgi:hypothetical protein
LAVPVAAIYWFFGKYRGVESEAPRSVVRDELRVEESGRAFPAHPPAADLAKAPSLDAAATNGQI